MRIITKKHLSRRAVLRGMGVTVALPFLDAMMPAQTVAAKTAAAKLRVGFVYVPHGAVMDQWTPAVEGTGFEFTRILKPLEPLREQLLVISGLANRAADPQGDGGGDHARSAPSFLSGIHPKRTEGLDLEAGTTVDQIAAQRIGQDTALPSLELGTEDPGLVGVCDGGYTCAYMGSIAWRTPSSPLPMEINPRIVFERLFGDGSTEEERVTRMREDSSILDAITAQMGRLQKGLGARDRARVSDYLDDVREIERRIQRAEKQTDAHLQAPEAPIGVPEASDEHVKLMFDLMALAWQGDITRVSTFMLARDLSMRTFPMIGVPDAFHATSHHQNNPDKIEKLTKMNVYNVGLLSYFLQKLQSTPDGDGSILDHSMILYGSSMSNPNEHNHTPLPLLIAGGANGQIKGGRHVKYPDRTPMPNLLLSLMDKAGVQLNSLGDSTGRLDIG